MSVCGEELSKKNKRFDPLKNLYVGRSIIIPRSDGRKNFATITNVDIDMKTVTVEWFENNEGKGKELLFADVIAQNPHLKFDDIIINNTNRKIINNESKINSFNNNLNRSVLKSNKAQLNEYRVNSSDFSNISKYIPARNNVQNSTLIKGRTRVSLIPPPSYSDSNIVKRQNRASVVVEVEKLRKNREERRQKQAETREEQKLLMNIYPKNPNWKFAKMIHDYQSTLVFTPITGNEIVENHQIIVCVRKRPLNRKEISCNEIDVISVPKKDVIIVHEPKNKVDLTKYLDNQHFYFDYVFDEHCNNDVVYKYTAKPLIETIFEGGMATCFAYGQTGSGKTHTMGGNFTGKKQDLEKGIYIMAAKDVFDYLNSSLYRDKNFIVSSTFFEIYQGKVFDLLAKKSRLRVLEDGKQRVQVVGLTEKVVTSLEAVLALLKLGNAARSSGKTSANSNSSRSHAVFQLILRLPKTKLVYGKFSLIDLAGNERGADTSSANRITQMEGAEINKSLLALKECIRALGRKGAHLPFRQSKLTQVLRDSFVGEKSKTCMIAMISPGMKSCEHTLNTLRYADRVKELMSSDPDMKDFPEESIIPIEEQIKPEWKVTKSLYDIEERNINNLNEDIDDLFIEQPAFESDISLALSQITNDQDKSNKDVDELAQQS
ncbi:hypothetical protein O3M35_001592 [Rhynocoris fuscipes]|uniref:Kinesin-like protein n=1 Tax=Rhynocoris fuscipes TaxID=488301 RepID=A0AAW1CN18_9HEMI